MSANEPVVVYEPRDLKPLPSEHTLAENEEVIGKGLGTFIDVGRALMEIRSGRQYIEAGFDSFEDYCKQRWGMNKTWASQHISSVKVVDAIGVSDRKLLPKNVEQTKPLISLLNTEGEAAVRTAWSQIVEEHRGDDAITGREVYKFLNPAIGVPPSQRPVGDAYLGALEKFRPAMKGLRWAIETYQDRVIPKQVQERFARYAPTIRALADAVEAIGEGEVPDPEDLNVGVWER